MLTTKLYVNRGVLFLFSLIIAFIAFLPSVAYAADSKSYTSDTIRNSSDPLDGVKVDYSGEVPVVEMPNVQIGQAKSFVEEKGFDIVELLQVFAQPFSIGMFILGAFFAVTGFLGKSSGVMKGLLMMGFAILIYAAILSGPELVDFGNSWLKS